MKILVVDDQLSCQISILESLQALGYEAKGVDNQKDALHWLKQDTYDVILTDYQLKENCSEEFIKECLQSMPQTPVILISGHLCKQAAERIENCGASAFLSKPFSVEMLRDCLLKVTNLKKEKKETVKPMSA